MIKYLPACVEFSVQIQYWQEKERKKEKIYINWISSKWKHLYIYIYWERKYWQAIYDKELVSRIYKDHF
jgi:hypothetical protein